MGVRIFALAKELGMTSKELIGFLQTQGHRVKSHMSSIDEPVAQILRDRYKPKAPPKPPPKKPAAAATGSGTATKTRSGEAKRGAATARKPAETPKAASEATRSRATPARTTGDGRGRAREEDGESREKSPKEKAKQQQPKKVRYFPSDDYSYQREARYASPRRKSRRGDPRGRESSTVQVERPEKVEVSLPLTVKDLSAKLGMKAPLVIKTFLQMGQMVNINQYLDEEQVVNLGIELGTEISFKKREDDTNELVKALDEYQSTDEELTPRAPVVTFLGHVDHGKTSLLDKIRESNVTQKEEGGITQHLGAYRIDRGNIHVTFIDTPGHKAFTEMRARGANATDVAVLVVAADDGPMPQTEEAINHARAAEVPIVVAINKMDLPSANPQRCKDALSKLGLLPAEWNGNTEFVEVSAHTGEGLDNLLEILSLESEILELKANPSRPAVGIVLEAEATTTRGVLATVLVKDGTLRVGDYVLCGASHGRVRNLLLNGVEPIEAAGPSTPVKVVGLSKVPEAGDKLYVMSSAKQAVQIAAAREHTQRESEMVVRQKLTLENLFQHLEEGSAKELNLIIKADVRGSIEALRSSLENLSTDEVKVRILHAAVGAVSQDDILLANASDAIIIGFHVTADDRARTLAEENDVEIRLYRVIYKAVDDIKAAMESRLDPEAVEEIHGHAEIRQVYRASKVGSIAGCMQTDGYISRNDKVRLARDGKVIYTGDLSSLKRFKDDVKEVKEGFECGIKIANFDDIKVGDVIEAFTTVEKKRNL